MNTSKKSSILASVLSGMEKHANNPDLLGAWARNNPTTAGILKAAPMAAPLSMAGPVGAVGAGLMARRLSPTTPAGFNAPAPPVNKNVGATSLAHELGHARDLRSLPMAVLGTIEAKTRDPLTRAVANARDSGNAQAIQVSKFLRDKPRQILEASASRTAMRGLEGFNNLGGTQV